MVDDIDSPEQDVSCMFIKGKKVLNGEEQLALFMHRFNLDLDTVETMPAFDEHRKLLFCKKIEK